MKSIYRIFQLIQIMGLRKPYFRGAHRIRKLTSRLKNINSSFALDLGSGPTPKNPFGASVITGVDIRSYDSSQVVYADLSLGSLPFDDNKFDFITAYDVLEHIPRVDSHNGRAIYPFVLLMNEVFRVLKPGGVFFNIQPCYPFKEAFQDPTHVNIMTEDTIYLYFCEPAWGRIYGYEGSFTVIEDGWCGSKYYSFLKKNHDQSIRDLDFVQK